MTMLTSHTRRRLPVSFATTFTLVLLLSALAPLASGAQEPRIVFTTSLTGLGDLSTWHDAAGATGLAAADAVCQARAAAADLDDPGSFVAWMSDSTDDAYCRIVGHAGKVSANCGQASLPTLSGGWVRTDGHPFATDLDAILDGIVYVPPRLDEFSDPVVVESAWTGTAGATATAFSQNCEDWTSSEEGVFGVAGAVDATWYEWVRSFEGFCSVDNHLLCFQTGPGPEVEVSRSEGALVFYSGEGRSDGAAVMSPEAADAQCQTYAGEAGLPLPATYRAWISDSPVDARDRFTYDGPWVRLDGVLVAENLEDLTDGGLFAPINVDPQGGYWGRVPPPSTPVVELAWTGTNVAGLGTGVDCQGWSTVFAFADAGRPEYADRNWTRNTNGVDPQPRDCSTAAGLYCFSEDPRSSQLLSIFADGFESGDTSKWTAP